MLLDALNVFSVAEIWTVVEASAAASGEHAGVDADVLEFLRSRFVGTTGAGLKAVATQLLHGPDRVAELAATGVAVLVAWGVDDDVWLPAEQAEMARRLGARWVEIGGAGHSPAIDQPERTVAALVDFWAVVTDVCTA
jgi:pimeloyl-ACP methyl ester carboxylesterase